VALACDLSSANATVFLTILYTDVSNTAQTQATTAANCTTLGAASVTAQAFLFMAKAETSIQYSTTIVNKPNYDVRISLQQLGIN
jgi:flagellar hook-basal body complex protein FliE